MERSTRHIIHLLAPVVALAGTVLLAVAAPEVQAQLFSLWILFCLLIVSVLLPGAAADANAQTFARYEQAQAQLRVPAQPGRRKNVK